MLLQPIHDIIGHAEAFFLAHALAKSPDWRASAPQSVGDCKAQHVGSEPPYSGLWS